MAARRCCGGTARRQGARLAAALAALVLAAPLAHADLAKGKAAFDAANFTLAYKELIEDAQGGNAEAEFMIGEIAAESPGPARSYAMAAQWYRLAAAKDYQPANLALGLLLLHGAGDSDDPSRVAADPAAAQRYLKAAADAGNAQAAALVGQLYMEGNGVPRDQAAALRYSVAAADHGIAAAQYNAGLLTLKGAGGAPDLIQAYKWFALAARAAYPGAEQNRRYVMGQLSAAQLRRAEALVAAVQPTP